MKRVILDTDVGIDCDDMVALAALLNLEKRKECILEAITLSTTRAGAASAVRSVCAYYGAKCPQIGKWRGEPLKADGKNVYAKALMERYGFDDSAEDAVLLLRKTLALSKEKCTLAVIGPQCNLAALLRSKPDEISPLSGIGLVREKIERIYIMGGNFDGSLPCAEFNIEQDISGAQLVGADCPVECVYLPFEGAHDILTGKGTLQQENNPVGESVRLLFQVEFPDTAEKDMARSSWDPVTALLAVRGLKAYGCVVKKGRIEVDSAGRTRFLAGGGNAVLIGGLQKEKIQNDIDGLCVKG
ncbi:MAG: nucleoside hydrolase [Clostridia bacterium]|nr:nucleoside hydrolase [Clostridia bacterium]